MPPLCLKDLVAPYIPKRARASQSAALFLILRVSKRVMGGTAFSYQALLQWNQLLIWFKKHRLFSLLRLGVKHFFSVQVSLISFAALGPVAGRPHMMHLATLL